MSNKKLDYLKLHISCIAVGLYGAFCNAYIFERSRNCLVQNAFCFFDIRRDADIYEEKA